MFCGPPDQLPASMLDLNWDQRTGPSGHFESSLGSIVPPSPSSSSPVSAESVAFRKFMGGSQTTIGNSGGMPPQFGQIGVRLNSSPKLDLSVTDHLHQAHQLRGLPMPGGDPIPRTHFDFSVAPGFAEASARFSMFDGHGHLAAQLGVLGTQNGESPKTNGIQNGFPEGRLQIPELGGLKLEINNDNLVNSREESSVSDSAKEEASNAKKRKAPPRGKGKSTGPDTSATDHSKDAKRCCSVEENGAENDEDKSNVEKNDGSSSNDGYGGHKQGKKSTTTKPTEPPKDYIHVRARRGQATDSHSLAERVRREKISQRMKLLQDLVPGCNKITGKAVMLDEIINYVQSLQRQVEFLSMKLATVNPHLDFSNLGNLLPKMHQTCGTKPKLVYSLEASGVTPPYADQSQERTSLHCLLPNGMETQGSRNQLPDSGFHRSLNTHQPLLAGFEGASTQIGNLWGDDFQNVHMDIGQN